MKLYPKQYFDHRLYFFDGRFRKDITYLLHAVNEYERSRLLGTVSVHMRMRKTEAENSHLTAGDIKRFSENPDFVENSYMFMKTIRGTAAYWKNNLLNLLAILKTLGPPSVFMTLSADDMHWPELIMTLKNCSYEEAEASGNVADLVRKGSISYSYTL